jgi:hypothetical protein
MTNLVHTINDKKNLSKEEKARLIFGYINRIEFKGPNNELQGLGYMALMGCYIGSLKAETLFFTKNKPQYYSCLRRSRIILELLILRDASSIAIDDQKLLINKIEQLIDGPPAASRDLADDIPVGANINLGMVLKPRIESNPIMVVMLPAPNGLILTDLLELLVDRFRRGKLRLNLSAFNYLIFIVGNYSRDSLKPRLNYDKRLSILHYYILIKCYLVSARRTVSFRRKKKNMSPR